MTFIVPQRVNIRNVNDVGAALAAHVESSTAIEIDLAGCDEIDLSLIQLIEAARKSADAGSKSINLTKPANDIVQATLKRAGFLDAFTADDAKFWLHKEVL
jgi:hypothetical protein